MRIGISGTGEMQALENKRSN